MNQDSTRKVYRFSAEKGSRRSAGEGRDRVGPTPLRKRSTGQSIVEFALIAPVLLLFIFGIIDMARLIQAQVTVSNAARTGVRWASTGQRELNPDGVTYKDRIVSIKEKTKAALTGLPLSTTSYPDEFGFYSIDLNPSDGAGPNEHVEMRVYYNVEMLTPLVNLVLPRVLVKGYERGINEEWGAVQTFNHASLPPAPPEPPTWTPAATRTPLPATQTYAAGLTAVAQTSTAIVVGTQTAVAAATNTSVASTATVRAGQTQTSVAQTVISVNATATSVVQTALAVNATNTSVAQTVTAVAVNATATSVAQTAISVNATATSVVQTALAVNATNTSVASTATAIAVNATSTSVAKTATANANATNTSVAGTATANANATSTAGAKTATAVAANATNTSVAGTATANANATNTSVAGTATANANATNTSVARTATSVAQTASAVNATNTSVAQTAVAANATNTSVAKTATANATATAAARATNTAIAAQLRFSSVQLVKPDGRTGIDMRVTLVDGFGNVVSGATVTVSGAWSGTLNDSGGGVYTKCNAGSFSGNNGGDVTVTFTATKAGYQSVSVTVTNSEGNFC